MASAFVPPAGLLDGTGPYTGWPAETRRKEYERLYLKWLGLNPPVTNNTIKPAEDSGYAGVDVYDLPVGVLSSNGKYQSDGHGGWIPAGSAPATPTITTTNPQATKTSSPVPRATGASAAGWSKTIVLGNYRLVGSGDVGDSLADGTWTLQEAVPGYTRNGLPDRWRTIGDAETAGRVIDALYAKTGKPQGTVIGDRMWWRQTLTPEEIQAAMASTPTIGAPAEVNPAETNPLTAPPAPGLSAPLANPPTIPGEVAPQDLASVAAQETVREIAAEMAKRQSAQEEVTLFAGQEFPGYRPIKLRPR